MSFLKQPFSDGCWAQKEKNNSDEASPRGREREKWKGRGANFKYRCGPGGGGAQLWQRRRRQTACSSFLKTVSSASASEGWSQREPVKTVKVRHVSVLACGVSRLTCQRQRVMRCPLGDVAQETHDSHCPPRTPRPLPRVSV